MTRTVHVAVVGAGGTRGGDEDDAEAVGRMLAEAGATVVCGGLGGVMAAVCRGARAAGGSTVGILPGPDRGDANPDVDLVIPSGLGEARNTLVVRAADVVLAIGGGHGTLSEIAFAAKVGTPVVGLHTWQLVRPDGAADDTIETAASPEEAVQLALALAARRLT
ncbi:MAG: LOG family protein [Actinobacteria bacterium]|nr:LOG family protein [Actinomycetota bacterium]